MLRSLDANWATSPLNVFFQCYFWKGDPRDTRIPRSLLAVGQLQWSDLRDEVSCGSLIALLELALTVVDAALSQRDTAGEILTLTLGEVELIGFVLDAIPLIFETRPNHNFDQMTVPGAFSNPLLVVRALFLEPGTLPQLLDCILARSDVLSTCKPRDLLLTALAYRCASFILSHPCNIPVLMHNIDRRWRGIQSHTLLALGNNTSRRSAYQGHHYP